MKEQFISASKGLWNNRWSTLLAITSIGICFFILSLLFVFIYNINNFTKKLSTKASVVIYLKRDIERKDLNLVMDELKKMELFSKINYISKDEALKEMKGIIDAQLIQLIGYNPLSDTIEAFIKEDKLQMIDSVMEKIKKLEPVEDIYYPSKIIGAIKTVRMTFINLGISLFILISIAILFIIYATVKSFYWKKTEDVEILKLLGATPSYIRLPFMIEGAILGLGGAIFSNLLFFAVYFIMHTRNIVELFPLLGNIELPLEGFYVLPLAGIILGMISSLFALGKIKYQ
ncbi:permease-like cell division protein FtsX [Thermodesulfovibrio sp.]|uniref:cell division protein FtsX n=1 Tax=Thermodesulfovibrio sp. TaxID=2067987 RepID=UPI0030A25EDA